MKKGYTDKRASTWASSITTLESTDARRPKAEMQQYFQVSPPSVHQMVLALAARGLIERTPGQARFIRLVIPREERPDLA
jgi:repressor LexA